MKDGTRGTIKRKSEWQKKKKNEVRKKKISKKKISKKKKERKEGRGEGVQCTCIDRKTASCYRLQGDGEGLTALKE